MALAVADESAEDLENLDLTTCKDRISQLQANRERMQERTERLQEKLKALNNELASRRLEAERKQEELQEEQLRNKTLAEERREAGEDGAKAESSKEADAGKVRQVVEAILGEKSMHKRKRTNAYGFREFDETDLMVERPMDDSNKEPPVDTVLITWHKPNSDDVRYNLTYRVDNKTPSKKLRKDACDYWGLSEVEYVLLTEENSKVHDDVILQHCFKNTERQKLILAQKNPRASQTALLEVEKNASQAMVGRFAKKERKADKLPTKEEEQSKRNQAGSFFEWLKDKPGLWDFMTQRDMNVIHHLKHIKLRNIVFYFLMLGATAAVLSLVRPVSSAYYLRNGPVTALTKLRVDGETLMIAKPYDQIRTREEVWDWMKIVLGSQLLDYNSELRDHMYAPGWLRIRMQQVKPASHETCKPAAAAPDEALCYADKYNDQTADKADIVTVRSYWAGWTPPVAPNYTNTTSSTTKFTTTTSTTTTTTTTTAASSTTTSTTTTTTTTTTFFRKVNLTGWDWDIPYPGVAGLDGRASDVNPYSFATDAHNVKEHNIRMTLGRLDEFDASGYDLDYDLQYQNMSLLNSAYRADMDFLKEWDWISEKTRAVHIEFTVFSGDYDLWVECKFLLEMPVNSLVIPHKRIDVFRPYTLDTAAWERVAVIDAVRALFLLYLITWNFYTEVKWQYANERSCMRYLVSFGGIADLVIVSNLIAIFVIRYVILGIAGDKATTFLETLASQNYAGVGMTIILWRYQSFCEAPVMIAIGFRFVTFLRINRQLFVIWETINESIRVLARYALVLVPIFLGLVVLAHTIWSSHAEYFSSMFDSAMTIIMMGQGDVPLQEIFYPTRPKTMIYGFFLYIVMWFILINGWAAVVIATYESVRVKAGFQPLEYRWKEYQYVQWCLCWPLQKCYFNVLRPRIERPRGVDEDDEDEEEGKKH